MSFPISIVRPRMSRLHFAVLGLAVCAISYMIIWDAETISFNSYSNADGGGLAEPGLRQNGRQLAFLDDTPPPAKLGYYQSSPQFSSLTQPSKIITKYQRQAAHYNPEDKNDSTCDDILLYMPHSIADKEGHGGQLNAYVLAAMIATYTNKAMVVLEPRPSLNPFKGASQFGCPKDARIKTDENGGWTTNLALPSGLSRLQRHPDWLSNKCPIPCQEVFMYKDWEKIREARKNSIYYPKVYTPNEVQCRNPETYRKTKILAVGGEEVRDYFDAHFREKMLERPSPAAFSWAMRLGASPEEAEEFVNLTDETQVWDYLSALMARSGIIRFQPWIARDLEAFIKEGNLPLEEDYDVIHVRRGDMLTQGTDHEATGHVKAFWSDKGFFHPDDEEVKSDPEKEAKVAPSNYIPFSHYLTQYDQVECSDAPRTVYIATDDPWEVKKEIEELNPNEDGIVSYKDGCHKFKFILNHYMDTSSATTLHLHDGPIEERCIERYQRNIASVADMMIAAKSETFIGEMNSGWSRLVRIFRMQLKERVEDDGESEGGSSSLVQRRMKVAWGNDPPMPPGL